MKNLKRLKDWYAGLLEPQKKSVHVTVGVMLFELALIVWSLMNGWVWIALVPVAFLILLVVSSVHMIKSFNRLNRTLREQQERLRRWYDELEP